MAFKAGVVLVVGAGFAKNAGMPLANEFTERLLDVNMLKENGPSVAQAAFLRRFVNETFNGGVDTPDEKWPELEDIFTLVDQSANSGHHLGRLYSAADLRVVRRAMIVRIVHMLQQAYKKQMKRRDADSKLLNALFDGLRLDNTAVLSMNWDMVFERGIALRQQVRHIEYGCHANPIRFQNDQVRKRRSAELGTRTLHLLKPHGSINWLYCDACREVFWLPPNETEKVAQTLFQDRDWRAVFGPTYKGTYPKSVRPHCPHCRSQSLGTRIATFSYRKALDFPMHAATWRTAEEHLKTATHWVFFGYSMPAADFEFKYLLKRVQLTGVIPPDITVITGGSNKAADETIRRYKQFFGDGPGDRHYFRAGLTKEVVSHLRSVEALNPDRRARRSNVKSASRRS
ncbi:hypothetical protein [Acidocella sp. C78]|uniref:hypothetical protein n=1 Tax=Acidocella sp. C78 TaxID=1671486 RepID=UPI00191B9EEF|nr:hypothetical protein [Acidocella sp. C78]